MTYEEARKELVRRVAKSIETESDNWVVVKSEGEWFFSAEDPKRKVKVELRYLDYQDEIGSFLIQGERFELSKNEVKQLKNVLKKIVKTRETLLVEEKLKEFKP